MGQLHRGASFRTVSCLSVPCLSAPMLPVHWSCIRCTSRHCSSRCIRDSLSKSFRKVPVVVASAVQGRAIQGLTAEQQTAVTTNEASWELPKVTEAKRVVLVRHGESTWNATGRIQGSSNFSELTVKGISQAETSRQMLASDNFDICFHSPLQRSSKTADIIWGNRSAPMQAVDDLREIDLYSFQGLFKEQGKERYGSQYRMWQRDAANFEIDGHFPVRELWHRACSCWDLMLQSPGSSILVVAHNAVNQALVATAIGLGPEFFRMLLQSNCGVSVLDFIPVLNPAPGCHHTLVSLNRLNQTPSPPVGPQQSSAGRKAKCRVIVVCNGATESSAQKKFPSPKDTLNMLGIVQSRKTSELLLDVRVNTIFSSPCPSARETASAIYEFQVAADCLGADCIPRDVDIVPLDSLSDFNYGALEGQVWSGNASYLGAVMSSNAGESLEALSERVAESWQAIRKNLSQAEAAWETASIAPGPITGASVSTGNGPASKVAETPEELPSGTIIVVTHALVVKAMIGHCLGLPPGDSLTFAVDEGALCVIDLPDGSQGRGVVRCLNYTAHFGRWAVPVTSPTFFDDSF